MNYLKVRWIHQCPSDPTLLLSELDSDRYEVRKVEVFSDGRMGFASAEQSSEDTVLSEGPIPTELEIATDTQFVVLEAGREEFEHAWIAAISHKPE
jgi:hypothetical protein